MARQRKLRVAAIGAEVKMLKGKKFHHNGPDENGNEVFSECIRSGEPIEVHARPLKSGEPLKLGYQIARARRVDEEHVEIEEMEVGSGPPKVTSNAYRHGWDKTFGKNGIN